MKQSELMNILNDVATGKVTKEEALLAIKEEPFKDMGFAKIDTHRGIRQVCLKLFMAQEKPRNK